MLFEVKLLQIIPNSYLEFDFFNFQSKPPQQSVIPLNEQCGLIEWVSNMRGLRQILLGIYRPRGLSMTARELRNCQLPKGEHHDE